MDAVWKERIIESEKGYKVFLGSPTDGIVRNNQAQVPMSEPAAEASLPSSSEEKAFSFK